MEIKGTTHVLVSHEKASRTIYTKYDYLDLSRFNKQRD